ncbi:MAG TPA: hypothetical protein VGH89_37025 [Pseudonocardia sp.]|jgi:hypothetical protein
MTGSGADQGGPASRRYKDITARMNEPLDRIHQQDTARLSELDERLAQLDQQIRASIARQEELQLLVTEYWDEVQIETLHEQWLFPRVDPVIDLTASPRDLDRLTELVGTRVRELRDVVRGRGVLAALGRARTDKPRPTDREQ